MSSDSLPAKAITCPGCRGRGHLMAYFIRYKPGHCGPSCRELPCHVCNGAKSVPEESLRWMEHGDMLRNRRINAGIGMREGADRLGIRASELCEIENGRVSNFHIDWKWESVDA